jgi:hypothetical protein
MELDVATVLFDAVILYVLSSIIVILFDPFISFLEMPPTLAALDIVIEPPLNPCKACVIMISPEPSFVRKESIGNSLSISLCIVTLA